MKVVSKALTETYKEFDISVTELKPAFVQFLQKKKIHTVVLLLNSDTADPCFVPGEDKDLAKPLLKKISTFILM